VEESKTSTPEPAPASTVVATSTAPNATAVTTIPDTTVATAMTTTTATTATTATTTTTGATVSATVSATVNTGATGVSAVEAVLAAVHTKKRLQTELLTSCQTPLLEYLKTRVAASSTQVHDYCILILTHPLHFSFFINLIHNIKLCTIVNKISNCCEL